MPEVPNVTPIAQAAEQLAHENVTRIKIAVGVLFGMIVFLAVVLTVVLIQIQHSRYADCIAQNARHDKTVAYIKHLGQVDSKHASASRRAAIRNQVAQDDVLIQDLAPHMNCAVKAQ